MSLTPEQMQPAENCSTYWRLLIFVSSRPITGEVMPEKYLVGKIFTQRIERHNLNLRIHIKRLARRRTICYSRSMEIHEKLIGAYIEKHHYNPLESLPNIGGELNRILGDFETLFTILWNLHLI
ncbi:conserved hypothetical protein [Xenorhabdus bovienii str. Jollieti]|uniref:Insertion element iso-IS1n protein insB n=1 Tax=Xenorhabdus bovienii (strain SS-2004) TaxID=406818 RepID=D3V2C1_XENBS|nr:conserved hypothetical protein [Xenorhabdus bovienii SS-2004]CBJ82895.1 Insertion element iso-IS1n protein insB [Xenorhabdus bovienii SS-2004]CDH29458.1 conserved hypothetical protein [Xenorhabdus bovienii str. Jollieti]